MRALKLLLVFLSCLSMAACVPPRGEQLAAVSDDDYGIGGTGIVGTVTGFGSVFVNGIEIEHDARTRLSVNGREVEHYPISIGETVEVLATDSAPYTHALRLNIRHEIIGPVSQWDAATGQLDILGQRIQVANPTDDWQPGQTLAVSGYLDAQGVIQARHVANASEGLLLLRGKAAFLRSRLEQAGFELSGAPLPTDDRDSVLRLSARIKQNVAEIDQLAPQRLLPFSGVRHWRIEGFSHRYHERWPGLASSSRQPIVFEVERDKTGQISVKMLDRSALPRGALLRRNGGASGSFGPAPQRSRNKGPSGRGQR